MPKSSVQIDDETYRKFNSLGFGHGFIQSFLLCCIKDLTNGGKNTIRHIAELADTYIGENR